MAGQGVLTIQGNVSGGPDGGRTFGPASILTSAAVNEVLTVDLAVGANTVAVPARCTALVVWPPNAVSAGGVVPNPSFGGLLTLKGAAGDTGIPVSGQWPQVLAWDENDAPAELVFTATVACSVVLWAM